MNENNKIEKITADAFIALYNLKNKSKYIIISYSDAPDIRCKDDSDNIFNFEITLTEDRPGDIQALLNRSDHKTSQSLSTHKCKGSSCLQSNVIETVVSRIQKKLDKDYGPNTALVVRDTTPTPWNWQNVIDQIGSDLDLSRNPFDRGIWVISNTLDKIYEILPDNKQ